MLILIVLHVDTFWLWSLFFHYLRCEIYGENDISVQLTELLGFLSWLCVGKHLREV